MNMRRFLVAALAIFIFALLWNAVVHLVLLREANAALAAIARPSAERSMALSLLQTAALSLIFVRGYASFRRTGTLKEGVSLGALFGVLAGLLVDLNQYIVYPIPGGLAGAWFAFGFVEFGIYGMLAALLYRVDAQPRGRPDLAQNAARGRLP